MVESNSWPVTYTYQNQQNSNTPDEFQLGYYSGVETHNPTYRKRTSMKIRGRTTGNLGSLHVPLSGPPDKKAT